jgi:rubredoxin
MEKQSEFKKYRCQECEHLYDESKGDPDSGFAPGTLWADIPNSWVCPICGAPKDFFKLVNE